MTRLLGRRVIRRAYAWVARRAQGRGEDGFILLESMIAMAVITIVMGAVGAEFVSSLAVTGQQRAQQTAVQLADSTVEQIRALHPSDLLSGRDPKTVASQFSKASAAIQPWLAQMDPAGDLTEGLAVDAGLTANIPTQGVVTVPGTSAPGAGAVSYTVNQYLGWCYIPVLSAAPQAPESPGSNSCVTETAFKQLGSGVTATKYLRAVVAVTWTGRRCGTADCAFVTSTLVSTDRDPTFQINAVAHSTPVVEPVADQVSFFGERNVNKQLLNVKPGTGVPGFTWAVTAGALPQGLVMDVGTGVISGDVTAPVGTYQVKFTVTDAFSRSDTTDWVTWKVLGKPTVSGSDRTDFLGATVSTALSTTCSNGPCSYTLTNAPTGLTVSNTGLITGTIGGTAKTYNVTATVTDNGGVSVTSSTFTWTVTYPPLTATNPGDQTDTVATSIVPVQLAATGGDGTYVWSDPSNTLPTGLTLSSTGKITGTVTATTTSPKAVTLTVNDPSAGATAKTVSFTWSIVNKPSITSPGAQTLTIGQTIGYTLPTSCPNGPCTYTLLNGPPGINIDSSGNVYGTVGGSATTYPNAALQAVDRDGATFTTAPATLTVKAKPTVAGINQNDTLGGTVNTPLTTTCTNTPCSYILTNAPTGLTVSNTGVITGTIGGTAKTYTGVTATVTDNGGVSVTSNTFTWTVLAQPTVSGTDRSDILGSTVNTTLTSTCSNGPCSYTLTNAPTGLTVSNTGVITGTIGGTAKTYTGVTAAVTDNGGVSVTSSTFTWTVSYPALAASNPANRTNTVGSNITPVQLSATGGDGTYVWSDPSNTLPTGLSLSSTGRITGTVSATTTSPKAVSLTVTDPTAGANYTKTVSFTWAVLTKPTVAGANQTNTLGGTVQAGVTTTCANGPCTYTLNNGPPGLTMSTAGLITGTIGGTAMTYAPTVTVTDNDQVSVTSDAFTWTVRARPTVSGVDRSNTLGATVNAALSTTCTNGPCTYTLNNGPTGLTVSNTGVITGTIGGSVTTYTGVTATVTDNNGVSATSSTFTWTVLAKSTVAGANQTNTLGGTVSTALSTTCSNGPCTYTLTNAPTGLTVSNTGVITGTIGGAATTYNNVTATVTDNNGVSATSSTFTWTVLAKSTVAGANQTNTLGGTVSTALSTTCSNGPCTYTLTNAPTGLTVSNTGVITGTIGGAATTYNNVTATVTDNNGVPVTSNTFTWTVLAKPTVASANRTNTLGGAVNTALSTTCTNTPCTYTLTNAPTGLTVSNTGVITGTIGGAATTYNNVTATVTDNNGVPVTSSTFTWTVLAKPTVSGTNQTSTLGATVSTALSTTCSNGPCSYTLTNAPTGLTVSNTGLITGTIGGTAKTYNVTATVTDNGGVSVTSSTFTWTVTYPPLTATNPGDQTDTVATSIVPVQLAATGGDGTYVWSDPSNTLPTGLTLSSTGKITGTVTATTTSPKAVTLTVNDPSAGATAKTVSFTWSIVNKPSITSPGAQTLTIGQTIGYTLPTSCPNGPCTYTLLNGPPGINIDSSGNVYGTVGGSATTYPNAALQAVDRDGATFTTAPATLTVKAKPTVAGTNQNDTLGGTVNTPLTTTCTNTPCSYILTNAPTGLTVSNTGVITGTIGGTAKTYTGVTATVTDNGGVSVTSNTFTWTVLAQPSLSGVNATAVGETATPSIPISYSCPAAPCTVALAGTVATSAIGLGLDTSAVNTSTNATRSITVSATSGTVYVNGLVSTSAVTNGASLAYSVSVAVTDDNGVSPAASTATYTAYSTPTVSTPGVVSTTRNGTPSKTLSFSCPTSSCTVTVSGLPSGIGLANSSNTSANNATSGTTQSGSGSFFLNGKVSASAPQTSSQVTVSITSAGTTITSSGTWTVS